MLSMRDRPESCLIVAMPFRTMYGVANRPASAIKFEPFLLESHQNAKANLPQGFPIDPTPLDFFSLFFTIDIIHTITKNTNQYAAIQQMKVEEQHSGEQHKWDEVLASELYVFLGAIIYIGIHKEPQISQYWNTDLGLGPIHTLPTHLPQYRFKQLKRFLHISSPNNDKRASYHLPNNNIWWYKLEPLALALQSSFQQYYLPSSEVSIDELMV
jgi:hypothetical protein